MDLTPLPIRVLLSLFVIAHLVTMGASVAEPTAAGKALRAWTKPYEKRFGVHQNWNMFAPNPPMSTEWLVADGLLRDGTERPIALPAPPPAPGDWILAYPRVGKFQRNATAQKRVELRKAITRWACREAKARGEPFAKVRFRRHIVRTPPMRDRAKAPREAWRVRVLDLDTWNCGK